MSIDQRDSLLNLHMYILLQNSSSQNSVQYNSFIFSSLILLAKTIH